MILTLVAVALASLLGVCVVLNLTRGGPGERPAVRVLPPCDTCGRAMWAFGDPPLTGKCERCRA